MSNDPATPPAADAPTPPPAHAPAVEPPKTDAPPAPPAELKPEVDKLALVRDITGDVIKVQDHVLCPDKQGKPTVGRVLVARPEDGRVTVAIMLDRGWPNLSPEATFSHFNGNDLLRLDLSEPFAAVCKAAAKNEAARAEARKAKDAKK